METNTNNHPNAETSKLMTDVRTLADEVRVRIHLAGMDLKDEWNKIEPHVFDLEKKVEGVTHDGLESLANRIRKVRAAL